MVDAETKFKSVKSESAKKIEKVTLEKNLFLFENNSKMPDALKAFGQTEWRMLYNRLETFGCALVHLGIRYLSTSIKLRSCLARQLDLICIRLSLF